MVQNVVNHRNSNFQEIVKSTKEEDNLEVHNNLIHNMLCTWEICLWETAFCIRQAIELCVIT